MKKVSSKRTSSRKTQAQKSRKGAESKKIIHPPPRRVLFRPDRYSYVKKLIPNQGCVFCQASQQSESFESLCVYKSDHSMVVLNKFPYNSGHLLIIPRAHKGSLLDLTEVEFNDLNRALRLSMQALQDIYKPLAMNVGLNQGKAAGAGIPDHLHYHLIPRWEGDLNFFPLIAETKVVIESLDQTYEKLNRYFKELRR